MNVTRKLLRQWCSCYKDERIADLVPEAGLTPVQLIDLEIPDADRVWGACHVLAREDRPALIALARKWSAAAAHAAAAAAADAADAADAAAAAAARWADAADAADDAADAAAHAAAAHWAADARKQQVADCREALVALEAKS